MKKIGTTMWGIALEESAAQFKMYVAKQPNCPEKIRSESGIWNYFDSVSNRWTPQTSLQINCATSAGREISGNSPFCRICLIFQ